jgi:hypothetical protein
MLSKRWLKLGISLGVGIGGFFLGWKFYKYLCKERISEIEEIKQKILLMSREEKYAFMVEEKFLNAKFHVNLR